MSKARPDIEIAILKRELVGLFGHLQKIRRELAALSLPGGGDHFNSMSEQLDAIIGATETATNTIMENMEGIDTALAEARASPAVAADPALGQVCDQINDRVNQVFEACSFQDITGQRISKVVNSLKFVEERINAIIVTWGREELTKVVVEIQKEADPERALMHGPQLPGQGISQTDVDALLDQDSIDKLFG
jgi:chemotaxis protein CheZ